MFILEGLVRENVLFYLLYCLIKYKLSFFVHFLNEIGSGWEEKEEQKDATNGKEERRTLKSC